MTRSTRGVETAVCLTLRLPAAVTEVALIFTLVHVSYHIDWFTVPCMIHPVLVRVSTRPSHRQILDVVGITEKTGARYVGGGPQQNDALKDEKGMAVVVVSGGKRPRRIPFGVEDASPSFNPPSSSLVVTTRVVESL